MGSFSFLRFPVSCPKSINLTIDSRELTLSAMRPLKFAHANALIRRLEIPHGRFFRRIPLAGVPLKLAASRYENGCLEVRLIREVAEERVR